MRTPSNCRACGVLGITDMAVRHRQLLLVLASSILATTVVQSAYWRRDPRGTTLEFPGDPYEHLYSLVNLRLGATILLAINGKVDM